MNKQLPGLGLIFLIGLGIPVGALAAVPNCIAKHYPGKTIQDKRINVKAPDIAEDGSVVSIGIESIKNMPDNTQIREVSFYNEFRDQPVARFAFGGNVKGDSIKTRVRLRESSHFYAVATLSNGDILAGRRFVKVTIGGCGGGGSAGSISNAKNICAD